MKRRVAVFTGTRAEYSLLRPVLSGLRSAEDVDLSLIVGGSHFSTEHGNTVEEIINDGFIPDVRVPLSRLGGSSADICADMGIALHGVGEGLSRLAPDILVVLGDRYETLAAATAATLCGCPLAHIHGGEITEGAVDDAFRHAVTKMSHLHFASCDIYRQRIIQLGEQPDNVFTVGALGVENVLRQPMLSEVEIRRVLGLETGQPYILCTFHPVTLEPGAEREQLLVFLQALDGYPQYTIVFTGANADAGGAEINHALEAWAAKQPGRARLFPSLGNIRYLSAARYAACVAGNSSSGIVEIPSLGTPVLDIGARQKGRVRSAAVLHGEPVFPILRDALATVLSEEHAVRAKQATNPYEKPGTSEAIVSQLRSRSLKGILNKKFYSILA